MSAGGGTKAIVAALLANAGIAVAKFVGFLITGSSSMLAESVHSVADTSNQGLLLLGQKTARSARPTREHPFGYGRDRYFYSFIVALMLFSLGSVFAIYEGIHKLQHPEPLTVADRRGRDPGGRDRAWSRSASAPRSSSRARSRATVAGGGSSASRARPELPVVLLEDAGALVGLVFALFGVGLAVITGDPVWDAVGTLCIGVLLGVIAIILIIEMKSLLIGEGATAARARRDLDGARRRQGAAAHPHPHAVPRPGRAAGGGEDRAGAGPAAGRRWRRRSTRPRRASASAVPAARLIYLEPDLDRTPATA